MYSLPFTVNDAQPFNATVTHLLDVIAGLPLGHDVLQEIQASRKSVGIAPFRAADNGNKCVAQNPRMDTVLTYRGFRRTTSGTCRTAGLPGYAQMSAMRAAGYGRYPYATQIERGAK